MSRARPHTITLRARAAAIARLNAFHACGQDDDRPTLYRTISVEFFPSGVQFISTNGHALLRAWAPALEAIREDFPLPEECPELAVVVQDVDRFSRTFLSTVLSATSGDGGEFELLTLTVERVEEADAPALGEELVQYGLTIAAVGQKLKCPLFEQEYPNWRALNLGIDATERVDGMAIAPKMFSMVGKLRGVSMVDCMFKGTERAILLHAFASVGRTESPADVHGLIMPMRREVEKPPKVRVEVTR